jgi:hypothetical protein
MVAINFRWLSTINDELKTSCIACPASDADSPLCQDQADCMARQTRVAFGVLPHKMRFSSVPAISRHNYLALSWPCGDGLARRVLLRPWWTCLNSSPLGHEESSSRRTSSPA